MKNFTKDKDMIASRDLTEEVYSNNIDGSDWVKFSQENVCDRLTMLLQLQSSFQSHLSRKYKYEIKADQEYINEQTLSLISEALEALRKTNWKRWRKTDCSDLEEFRNEIIDIWHFLINLTLVSGMNTDELFYRFIIKNNENWERQRNGY